MGCGRRTLQIVRVAELEQQLQQERRARVGAERWLEAELRSKEEMQTLFCSVRDLALDKQKAKETESQSLRAAVDKLHATESTVLRYALEFQVWGLHESRSHLALRSICRAASRGLVLALFLESFQRVVVILDHRLLDGHEQLVRHRGGQRPILELKDSTLPIKMTNKRTGDFLGPITRLQLLGLRCRSISLANSNGAACGLLSDPHHAC